MTADTVGGVWTYAIELSRALARHDVEVALLTMGAPLSASQRRDAASVDRLSVFETSLKLEWMDDPWDDVRRAGDQLLALEREVRPDVIHLNGYAHAALPFVTPTLVVAHSCVLSWWEAVKREPAPAAWDRYAEAVAAGLHAADRVVAPSLAMLDALHRHYGPLRHASVVYNGIDHARFAPAAAKRPVVLAAGRAWDEAKNVGALASIAGSLDWPVHLAGPDRHPQTGQRLGFENVVPLGTLAPDAMRQAMAEAAIYALPARYEPFGLSILEAALSGCVLVLGDIPSLREIWGDTAIFVPPDDHAALRLALQRLIAMSDAGRAELVARSLARARRYTIDAAASSYRRIHRTLTTGRRAPATRDTLAVPDAAWASLQGHTA
jgi:glycosyltransferase involved in cell wall biosynthesis